MKNTQNIASLIAKLEYEVGRECYNPNSYDGWTGDEGCEFRYPVYIRAGDSDEELTKIRGNVADRIPNITPKSVSTMKYKFGANHLFIGLGIKSILEELENRYGLNFNELEKQKKKN